jgi:hypothetical protein
MASKITTDSHVRAHVNIECPDDRYPKLKILVSELISNNYDYIPVVSVTMHDLTFSKLIIARSMGTVGFLIKYANESTR